ncbi:MAG TPA: hypothetical protein VFS43_03810 [Polyangiaceae bacterium]|nr:hypothetical protein [Polyangiaceae bacterium]
MFDQLFFTDATGYETASGLVLLLRLALPAPIRLRPPGLNAVALVIGPASDDAWSYIDAELVVGPEPSATLRDVPLSLQVDRQLLQPMLSLTEPDPSKEVTEVALGSVTLSAGPDGIVLQQQIEATLPLCQIASSGVVLESGTVRWLAPDEPPDDELELAPPPGFTGVYISSARVHLPRIATLPPTVLFRNCYIGTGGFSGGVELEELRLEWDGDHFTGDVHGELIGFQGGLKSLNLMFVDSQLVSGAIAGDLFLPWFKKRVGVELSLADDGSLSATIGQPHSITVPPNPADPTVPLPPPPGYLLHLAIGEVLALDVDRVHIEKRPDAPPLFEISGRAALNVEAGPVRVNAQVDTLSVRFGGGKGTKFGFQGIQINGSSKLDLAELVLGEARADGSTFHRLALGVGQPLPLGGSGIVLEQGTFALEFLYEGSSYGDWKALFANSLLEVMRFRLTGGVIPGGAISGDMRIVFEDGALQTDRSFLKRSESNRQAISDLGLKHVHVSRESVAIAISESRINYWFGQLAPNLTDSSQPATHEITLRVLIGDPIKELRFDWAVEGAARTLRLPGLQIVTPDNVRLSLLLGAGGRPVSNLALALTFEQGSELTARSNFAWERDDEREIHSGESDQPLLTLSAKAETRATLVLLDWDLDQGGLPKFFRQLASPLPVFDWSNTDTLAQPTPYDPISLRDADWDVDVIVNPDALPFLRGGSGAESQVLEIDKGRTSFEVRLDEQIIHVDLGLNVNIGTMRLETGVPLEFNWETFAFKVDHDFGLDVLAKTETLDLGQNSEFLGLHWTFRGAPAKDRKNNPIPGRYHFFTLATKGHNYSLVQAPGAVFEVEYTQLSEDGVGFSIEGFALSPKGISLTAEVIDRPSKLNGIDTEFRFADSRLVIVENKIIDFTLKGSGPLPPALVGDATADIALQFAQRDGKLTLVSGGAQLNGLKLIGPSGTRFQFSVQALGLKFVNEGKFHLYFTVTGSAQFVPLPGDLDGALALLGKIQIDLVECPLAGDVRVLAKHVRFFVELPKPKPFNFLGAFEMELRGVGFVPQAEVFDGDPAMLIAGQLKFAQGAGDAADSRSDLHKLYIGLPKKGSIVPRIHFANLPVNLNFGSAFRLNGVVDFVDGALEKGFTGEGSLAIEGLPTFVAAFAFLRVRRDETSPWVRAWFVYAEVRKVSFQIPVIPIFLREVGLGFGYRYTLASIKVADQANDVGKLLKELRTLSRTQGDLSKRDRWSVDLEDPGQDPRWTVAFRAMLSQTSASTSPLKYDEGAEKNLACLFLLDAVVALRSDLTFLMTARGWLFANYHDYVTDYKGMREKPVVSGFVLLSPRKKRFLAHVASNPGGQFGPHPQMPKLVERALANSQFSATLLIEPGLLHTELGWPNQLRWSDKLGPLQAEFRGGFIFRVSRDELVTGVSYLARASLDVKAEVSLGVVGVRVRAEVRVAYGGRFIGLLSFRDPLNSSAMYGGIGLEVMIRFSVEFWLKIKIWRVKITKTWRFSFMLEFTASIEFGVVGISPSGVGLRGRGHLAVAVMGRRFAISVKLGLNEGAVNKALDRTKRVLNLGLEAAEVEAIPGTTGTGGALAAARPARRLAGPARHTIAAPPRPGEAMSTPEALSRPGEALSALGAPPRPGEALSALEAPSKLDEALSMLEAPRAAGVPSAKAEARPAELGAAEVPAFQIPGYSVFVVRGATGEASYFVLMPAGERPDGSDEPGFLPVPPRDGLDVAADFTMTIPGGGSYTLEQYVPLAGANTGAWVARAPGAGGARTFSWSVDWGTTIAEGERHALDPQGGAADEDPTPREFVLREYLRNAFIVTETDVPGEPEAEPIVTPVRDPATLPGADLVEDERVHNPTEASFEAAVRGALEQFRGSPYFKRDPNSEYEQLLERAYREDTTVYSESGEGPEEDAVLGEQQAHELRGLVIHDLVSDLRDYAKAARGKTTPPPAPAGSIAFAMGLVFRVTGELPAWLNDAVGEAQRPKLSQRLSPEAPAPSGELAQVRTFNVRSADFASNPPRFERVQQLSDASTIALAWDLVWPEPPAGDLTPAQRDPDHHLVHYLVRRRPLAGNEREAVYTVKGADTLHREAGGVMKQLRRRFQLVDHFDETAEDLASLPVAGKSYLYSITPVDFAGNAGRPLSLVATRFPTDPPAVPVDGEATVHYLVSAATLDPGAALPPTADPPLVLPQAFTVRWTEPPASQGGPSIPIGTYWLVFRRETTLPIGSYGLDGSTQRPAETSLPTTNARPLPTDIKVQIFPSGPADARVAEVSIGELQLAGVLPEGGDPRWRPEAWRVYFQTRSLNEVPSSLAPLKVLLRVEANTGAPFDPLGTPSDRREERRPAELEWLPKPMRFPLLPPEDELATVGTVHVPMPVASGTSTPPLVFDPSLSNLRHGAHPAGLRCVRFRWNQGPSGNAGYPLDLNAGYQLLELDADAHTTETFGNKERLAEALRVLQDVQMIPADELALVPADTLAPSQWEAWYPSAVSRRREPAERAEGSEIPVGPWHSWRESILEWPAWPGLTGATEAGVRDEAYHPSLRAIVDALSATYHVELQATPAMQAQDLAAFLKATAPSSDPYGWGILQRFGLSAAFRLRTLDTGEIVTGSALLEAVDAALSAGDGVASKHLHIELLFQPGRAVELEGQEAKAGGLLALIQLSLRPAFKQVRFYGRVALEGRPGERVVLAITLPKDTSCSLVDQGDLATGQVELSAGPGGSTVRRSVLLPLGGRTTLLLRSTMLPLLSVALVGKDDSTTPLSVEPFEATDEQAAYFTIGTGALAAEFASTTTEGPRPPAEAAWTAFRRYAESLSSTDPAVPDDQKIRVPATKDELEPIVAECAAWLQRFFDHGPGDKKPIEQPWAERPWVATAYPRAGSPAHAAPDEGGRLTYDHLLEDPWAHAYRYYLRPYGRYDLLWQGLRQSPLLFTGTPRLDEATPETTGGGLDVVLERTRPVAKPLVLSSMRLDPPSTEASPAVPGATWEVIVAEHPEQTLASHNQTLARQLSFRQVAYTLLREFAYPRWLEKLDITLEPVPERYPPPPAALPPAPEHLDLGAPLADVDARTLDLPARIGPFQQGALALQWEGLPFYYEHRLLLIAQTARTVSPVNEIVQRDFEYRTPDPISEMESAIVAWAPPPPFGGGGGPIDVRGRAVHLTLRQLWDSLPADAQARWPGEAPDGTRRAPGWAPDLGVVYQIVELFSGNVEVQAEIYFDEQTGAFARRQFGKRFLVDVGALDAPEGGGTYSLAVAVQQITQQQLSRAYTGDELAGVEASTRAKIAFDGKLLSFVGVLTHADRDRLVVALDEADAPAIRSIHDGWYSQTAVSQAPAIPAELADVVDSPEPAELRLVWEGPMSEVEKTELLALPGDDEFKTALGRLASAVGGGEGVISIGAPLGPEHVPAALKPRLTLMLDAGGHAYTALRWAGNLDDADAGALTAWPRVQALSSAVAALLSAADEATFTVALPPPRPIPEELPPEIAERLEIAETELRWLGPAPADDERAALGALEGDEGFLAARAQLVAAIDAERAVPLGPVVERPTQDDLPESLAQLQLGATELTWALPAPTAAQREALLALPADRDFRAAVEALLAALDAGEVNTAPLAAFVPRPAQGELPAPLRARLLIGEGTLTWTSPAPNDAERSALVALVADDALIDALVTLVQQIDADRSVPMAPWPRRPRQADLPEWLDGQLDIAPTALTWRGRLHDPQWRAGLAALAGDEPFVAGVQQILSQIDAQTIEAPFAVAARPAPDALGGLADKLLLGRALLRFHGLMARSEVPVIQSLFARATDRRAVARLYQAAQSSGMRGRELRVRSRRGAAPPSTLHPILPKAL